MSQLAIKGHAIRGKEVIEILEMLGGKNRFYYDGTFKELIYTIGSELELDVFNINSPSVKNDYIIFTLKEFLEKFPYKVGDVVLVKPYVGARQICEMKWDSDDNCIKYGIGVGEWFKVLQLQPYKEQETMEELKINLSLAQMDGEQIIIPIPKGYKFFGVNDDNRRVVFTKIQSKYPKTHLECCDVLGRTLPITDDVEGYKWELMMNFQRLLVCRDAYWKRAGEEMGLNKPWEPDWLNVEQDKYVLYTHNNSICSNCYMLGNNVLAFPTEEIRDVFYENFKDLIEQCKELL